MPVKKKTTPPAVTREWETIRDEWEQMSSMSCIPSKKRLSPDYVLDEDQTVRWNREQVEKHNAEVEQEVKDLNTKKNKWRDTIQDEIYTKIVSELSGHVDMKGAMKIFSYAYNKGYNKGHSSGFYTVFSYLMELLEFFEDVLGVQES